MSPLPHAWGVLLVLPTEWRYFSPTIPYVMQLQMRHINDFLSTTAKSTVPGQ